MMFGGSVSVLKIKRLWQLLLSLHRNLDTFQAGHDPEGGSEFRCGNAGFVRIPHGVLFAYSDPYVRTFSDVFGCTYSKFASVKCLSCQSENFQLFLRLWHSS